MTDQLTLIEKPEMTRQVFTDAIRDNLIMYLDYGADEAAERALELVDKHWPELNYFDYIDQETMDWQVEEYGDDSYHSGLSEGDLAWVQGDISHSLECVELWHQTTEVINGSTAAQSAIYECVISVLSGQYLPPSE